MTGEKQLNCSFLYHCDMSRLLVHVPSLYSDCVEYLWEDASIIHTEVSAI